MSEFLKEMENWESYSPVNSARFSEAEIEKALDLIENKPGWHSKLWEARLYEAITTSDFPVLFGQIVTREMIAKYTGITPDWKSYVKVGKTNDFRTVTREAVYDTDELEKVVEKGEYLVAPHAQGRYSGAVEKYGRSFDISYESMVNDIMNAFADVPERFSRAAANTEALIATRLIADAAGPNAALFGDTVSDPASGADITNKGVLALTIDNLETTLNLIAAQLHPLDGSQLGIRGVHLVVPSALELTARKILNSTQISRITDGEVLPNINILPQMGLQLHVNTYLNRVDASANVNRTWYVFASPGEGVAAEYLQMSGHEAPEICMKASNKVTPTGAPISPMSGDFETDNIFYRVRMIGGGIRRDPRYAYAQAPTS